MPKTCKTCKGELINGTGHTLSAVSKNFEVTVENIPAAVCPRGHEGLYWNDRGFGPAFTERLTTDGIMAKGKRTWTLRLLHLCVNCGGELDRVKAGHTFEFEFDSPTFKGRFMKVTLRAPALLCRRCNRHFMPHDKGELDMYYHELHTLIRDALKRDFVL